MYLTSGRRETLLLLTYEPVGGRVGDILMRERERERKKRKRVGGGPLAAVFSSYCPWDTIGGVTKRGRAKLLAERHIRFGNGAPENDGEKFSDHVPGHPRRSSAFRL